MTLDQAQELVDNWIKTIGVKYFDELTNTAILMEEVGELARIMARKYGQQSFKYEISEAEIKSKMAEEMSDVLFVLLCLANQTGINISEALLAKIDVKTKRDFDRHQNNPKLK